jgi:hypothetical protein
MVLMIRYLKYENLQEQWPSTEGQPVVDREEGWNKLGLLFSSGEEASVTPSEGDCVPNDSTEGTTTYGLEAT